MKKIKQPKTPKLYKIDKGMSLPEVASTTGKIPTVSKASLTMAAMSKGDSFLIVDELEAMKAVKVVMDANGRTRKRGTGSLFATRRLKKGTRIWRVS